MSGGAFGRWVGQAVLRHEDGALLTGRGEFIDDIPMRNMLHVAIVRSPFPHARIHSVDMSAALAHPGVVTGMTGAEAVSLTAPFQAATVAPIHYHCMADGKARYQGEPVAAIVASDRYVAEDAAELVEVEYEQLPAAANIDQALEKEAPLVHETMDSNVAIHRQMSYGDPEGAFEKADLIVTEEFAWERYSSTPIETFGVIASYNPATEVLTIRTNFMGPMTLLTLVARALRIDESKLRLITPEDIGGSFGIKCAIFPYMVLVGLLAMKTNRTVKWIEDRREHLIGSTHQPDRKSVRQLALTQDGEILGMRVKIIDNLGAYIRAPEPASTFMPLGAVVSGYRTPNVAVDYMDIVSNRVPTGPNRGYGRQQIYMELERTLDSAAKALELDPAELRRRNLIQADQFPYETPTGGIYDSGDYPAVFELALQRAGYEELRQFQRAARVDGRLIGIGISTAVDSSVSNMGYITVALPPEVRARPDYLPKSGAMDWAQVRLDPRGRVIVTMGTAPQGQGHRTTTAQVVADALGVDPDDVTVVDEFDSHRSIWSISSGTYASRFASVGLSAVQKSSMVVKDQILRIAAHLLEASVHDLELKDGRVEVRGTDKSVTLKRVAGVAHWDTSSLPPGMTAGIQASEVFNFEFSKPPTLDDRINGLHTYGFIVEVIAVEVDPRTWQTRVIKHSSVHDAGTIINPKLVEGQVYGGAVHGLGGALFEEFRYDEEGQFLSGTFSDYRCPTAAETWPIDLAHIETPSPHTPLGSKGAGEASAMS
ncbi:MAG: xanthine dehydrogenase family protein molybdopterin-binding subunit, partial [Acidimicrobiia bacterium]